MRRVYLDHCATTPVSPAAAAAMQPYFSGTFGNASSVHRYGQEARAALDGFRAKIASMIGARPGEVIFTSGGTEADNHAIKGAAQEALRTGRNRIVTTTAEHHAVLDTCAHLGLLGFDIAYIPVDGNGLVSPDDVRRAIDHRTALVSVMHANNEIGSINPIEAIAAAAREAGVPFHTDAVQSFGKILLRAGDDGPDLISVSAHKLNGPKGIGALIVRKGLKIEKFMHGGGQERGARAGTENVALAAGFAAAAEEAFAAMGTEAPRLRGLRERLRERLKEGIPGIVVNGHPEMVLPGVLNVSIPDSVADVDAEALLFNLDLEGVAASSGSACTSGSIEPSHVLLAIGRNRATASASLRLSLGAVTTSDDVEYAADRIVAVVRRIGRPRPSAPTP
jgi:cysteine desulfurase